MRVVGGALAETAPLERLASEFHQDFKLLDIDVLGAATRHIRNLNLEQRRLLKMELAKFLADHPGNSNRGITNAWFRLGAQWWPRRADTREILNSVLQIL